MQKFPLSQIFFHSQPSITGTKKNLLSMLDKKFGQFGELSSDDPAQDTFSFTKKQKPDLLLIFKKEENKDFEIIGQTTKRGESLMFILLNALFLGIPRKFFVKKKEDETHITLKSGRTTVEVLPKKEFKEHWK